MNADGILHFSRLLRKEFDDADFFERNQLIEQCEGYGLYVLAKEFESDLSFDTQYKKDVNQECEAVGSDHRLI